MPTGSVRTAPEDAKNYFTVLKQDFNSGISFSGTNVIATLQGDYVNATKDKTPIVYFSDITLVDGNRLVAPVMENSVVNGIPINGFQYYQENVRPNISPQLEMSHLELQNSMMSHQSWRNWGTLMEVELAVFEDLGYKIDRKCFFGTSVYENGNSNIEVRQAFSEHTGDNRTNTPSTQPWAIGTHLYGSLNTVKISADQLADGPTSIGVRIDGVKNTVSMTENTLISANGAGGLGIAVTYGRNHTLTIDEGSEVQALGVDGRALSFDFGTNVLGDFEEYRGSFTRSYYKDGAWKDSGVTLLDALNGHLVNDVAINGKVTAGPEGLAIYIAPNASVANITLGKTAEITGDIVSLWNAQTREVDDFWLAENSRYPGLTLKVKKGTDITTNLTLSGKRYDGNIWGANGIRLTIASASESDIATVDNDNVTTFTGLAQVLGVTIKPGSTLTGGGTFVLTAPRDKNTCARVDTDSGFVQQTFVNNGKLYSTAATGLVTIVGDFEQKENSSLVLGIDGNQTLRGLTVTGKATFADNIHIDLMPDFTYYASNTTLTAKNVKGSPVNGHYINSQVSYSLIGQEEFDKLFGNVSETLTFKWEDESISIERKPNAYSATLNGKLPGWQQRIGEILDANANTVTDPSARSLYALLDFTPNGKTGIVSNTGKLGGDSLMMGVRSHFALERLLDRTFAFAHENPAPDGKSLWVQPFGGKVSERFGKGNADSDIAGVAGGVTLQNQNLTAGWHLASAYMKTKDSVGGKTEAEGLWFGGSVRDFPSNNSTWFIEGNARLGLMNSETQRTVAGLSDETLKTEGMRYSVSAWARVGMQFNLASVELSPVAGLAATLLRTPSDTENGVGGLDVRSQWYKSVRAQLGLKASTEYLPSQIKGYSWKWNAYAMYERELTDDAGNFKAGLSGMSGTFTREVTFNDQNRYLVGVSLGLFNEMGFAASLRLDSEMTHGQGSAVTGSAQLRWKF